MSEHPRRKALGLLEAFGFTPAMVALDAMEKAANIQLLQAEINDMLGIMIKIVGDVDSVTQAIEVGHKMADQMKGRPVSDVIAMPNDDIWGVVNGPREHNPLIQQDVVHIPRPFSSKGDATLADSTASFALGFIETQGFTAVFEAIDTACKAANVEVLGKEKLGGGYVTVIVKGDVAAVKAAIESGRVKVEGLGKLIAAHVIPRPSESVLSLLPPVAK